MIWLIVLVSFVILAIFLCVVIPPADMPRRGLVDIIMDKTDTPKLFDKIDTPEEHFVDYDDCYMMADTIVKHGLVTIPSWLPEGEDYTFWLANDMLSNKSMYDRAKNQYDAFTRRSHNRALEQKRRDQWDEFQTLVGENVRAMIYNLDTSDLEFEEKKYVIRREANELLGEEYERMFGQEVEIKSWDGASITKRLGIPDKKETLGYLN